MKNPYEAELADDRILSGRSALIAFSVLFCLFLLFPAAVQLIRKEGITFAGETNRRAAMEKSVESQSLFENWRRADQTLFLKAFGKGNRRVVVGRDGWLYYRPDLEAVYGKGPRYEEPTTVAREAVDDSWQPPIAAIVAFAEQLQQRGIELTVVPVPTKPMLAPSGLVDGSNEILRADYDEILTELRDAGVDVVDLVPLLEQIPESQRYLKQDTHWSAATMEKVAAQFQKSENSTYQKQEIERSHTGDLVGMLDTASPIYPEEKQTLRRVIGASTSDPQSEIVLLGDSFVNIYEDPALGFGAEGEESIGAGFASHLAAAIGQPVHTIAVNGGGSTAARRAFVLLPDDVVRSKERVIWVFSARDLLLAELPARRAGIEWRAVEFNRENSPKKSTSSLVVTATLSERSPVGDPKQTPYESAVYSAIFTNIEGDYDKEELFAFLWAFKKRILEPTAGLEPGSRYRLHLIPFDGSAEAGRATQIDDFFRTDLDRWFVEKAEPLP